MKGYDVGFGAKKHFATFDLASKAPNFIAIVTLTTGVIQLGFNIAHTLNQIISVVLIFIGIVAIFFNFYTDNKKEYEIAGVKINTIYQKLRDLYFSVQATNDETRLKELETEYKDLVNEFNGTGITHQMMFSDWYAHYKFFVQLETDWIEEQRPFKFRDKVPLGLRWSLYVIGAAIAISIITIIVLQVKNVYFI